MKKKRESESEMREEYDFENSRPNPYLERYAAGIQIRVHKRPKEAKGFPDAKRVNDVLGFPREDRPSGTHLAKVA